MRKERLETLSSQTLIELFKEMSYHIEKMDPPPYYELWKRQDIQDILILRGHKIETYRDRETGELIVSVTDDEIPF